MLHAKRGNCQRRKADGGEVVDEAPPLITKRIDFQSASVPLTHPWK